MNTLDTCVGRVEGVAVLLDQLGLRPERDVGRVVRQVQEKRPALVIVQELDGATGQLVLALAPLGLGRRRVGPAGVDHVEAVLVGAEAGAAEVPLADAGRGVTGVLQILGDGLLVERQLLVDLRVEQLLRRGVGAAGQEGGQVQAGRRLAGQERRARR